jgi:transposase
VTRKGFEARIRELVTGQATLERIAEAMLSARAALKAEYEKLHQAVLAIVREDAVCRRLMTVPSVGPLVAITYKSALDDPSRIASRRRQERCSGSHRRSISRVKKISLAGSREPATRWCARHSMKLPMFCCRG